MTYVSRRARITVPRWPNDFDPEFLFRVGRRCDGRLKRHSSCHDLRAWINDNCIKHEYLLDLMSDGEVTLRPPLQLYGRFIPVPILFKLLQNSRSEGGANDIDSNEIVQRSAPGDYEPEIYSKKSSPGVSERDIDSNRSAAGVSEQDIDSKRSAAGVSERDIDSKRSAAGVSERDIDSKKSAAGVSYPDTNSKRSSPGVSERDIDSKRSAPTVSDVRDNSRKANVHWTAGEKDSKSGTSIAGSDKSKASGATYSKGKESRATLDDVTHSGLVFGEREDPAGGNEAIPTGRTVQRKWDPFEKMEYYTSGFASKGALVEGVTPRPISTESTLFLDDDYENMRSKSASQKSGSEGSLARVLWQRDVAEKNLFKSTCLLTKALGKLEKIDNIIQAGNEEREKMRKGEIHEAFRKPTLNCIYLTCQRQTVKSPTSGIRYRVRSPGEQDRQNTLKCNELLRQISGLREKLKRNQECQQKVNQEITMSQKEGESGASPFLAELSTDEGEAHMRKLQRRLEKLINHRGKLLSDMCQALTQLNNLKRCRNSKVDVRQRSRSGENRYTNLHCNCPCRVCQSSESEKVHCSDSGSSTDNQFRRADDNFKLNDDKNYYDYSSTDNLDSGQQNLNDEDPNRTTDTLNESSYASNGEIYKDNHQEKERRKSILKFCCPDPPCQQDPDAGFRASEKHLPSGQSSLVRGPLAGNSPYRPNTSPTTKREKWDASEERRYFPYGNNPQEIPERRVKSETTMKEIEKTLRNYEQRLSDMDGLEYKVEDWKKKLLEACKWKKSAWKVEEQMKKEKEDERNKATIEINGLFTQNYELKKQVRQLIDKSKEQAKKIQNMKCSVLKAKELECEAEELKKELTEYRNSYESQRKCISKWESVVALQRKEIENLMNHIRKLTTEKKEQMNVFCQERKCIQRTRSCSPVNLVDCQTYCRPETYNLRSDEDNGSCCCQDFRQPDSRRNQIKFFDKNYYSSLTEREDWCN